MNFITFKNFLKEFVLTISLFFIILISVFSYFSYQHNNSINNYLNDLSRQYELQYHITYDNFHQLSQNTFYGIINKPEIYNLVKYAFKNDEKTQSFYRQVLYDRLLSDYNRLLDFKFKQVHFHFPDNTSFLRMHKPDKFGDDLSDYRFSITEVNRTLKPLNGYEVGKIVDGYRFVYPIFDESLFHVGSIEISVDSSFFDKTFEQNFGVDTHFLVRKSMAEKRMFPEIFKEFKVSHENDKYIYSENVNEEFLHYTDPEFYSLEEKNLIFSKMENGEKFIMNKKYKDKYLAIYFLPIPDIQGNKNAAYMVLYKLFAFIIMPKNNHKKSRNLFINEAKKLYQKEFIKWFKLTAEINPVLKWFRQKELNIPTFYVMGEEDYMFLPAVKKVVSEHTQSSSLFVIENCGHVVNVDKAHVFNEKVIEFITQQNS